MADTSKAENERGSSQGEPVIGEPPSPTSPGGTPAAPGVAAFPGMPGAATPPMLPGQALQLLIHQGMAVPQQNPEVVKHVTAFLAHDSDNKLQAMKDTSERNHTFRLTALGFLCLVVVLTFSIPLVALYRGDMQFVSKFMDDYMRYFIVAGLALLAGAKIPDFFK